MSRSHAFFFTARHALCVNLLLWISLAQATGTGTSLVDTSEDSPALDEVSHHGRINKASSLLGQNLVHLQGFIGGFVLHTRHYCLHRRRRGFRRYMFLVRAQEA